jgi:DhnA family fructose-bisphosphate aldolase class Ia
MSERFKLSVSARRLSGLSRHNLLAFVEPLPMKRDGKGYVTNYSVAELVKWVGVCAGLGETSRNTWLKIPYIPGFEQVALATTLPILLLGGPAHGDPLPTLKECAAGIACGRNVRGTMVGRNVLFPGDEDPLSMTAAVAAVIRHGTTPAGAVLAMDEARNTSMDALTRYL